MATSEHLQICDRQLIINYFIKSPVRYACERVFAHFTTSPYVPTHKTLNVDVLDRPSGGVMFPQGKVLVEGSIWTLIEKGDYLFIRINSPLESTGVMEAIYSANRDRLKVFVDTPWICQQGFNSGWNLLLQIVFRASLKPEEELLVRGVGLIVGNKGFLVNVVQSDKAGEILDNLRETFPGTGKNKLLLRSEGADFYIYSTPWTRNGDANHPTNSKLDKIVLIRPAENNETKSLSAEDVLANFGPIQSETVISSHLETNYHTLLEKLPAFNLGFASEDHIAEELRRLAK